MPPKVLAKSNDRPSGILPVTAANRTAASKGPQPRLKLEVRRLPPGLTLTEFEEALGEGWKLGNGKIDWREYRHGKVKHGLGKVPEQSRCYIHLVNEGAVKEFEARFLAVEFQDKANTYKNPDLKHLPPTIGFAPNQRTPLNVKSRVDSRQGTIDQDAEFIRFLEAETQPITKSAALDSVSAEKPEVEKVEIKSTPLIEALREKKANKAKAAEIKAEKKESKGHSRSGSKDENAIAKKGGKEEKSDQLKKGEQTSKEAGKAVNKPVASKQGHQRPASPQQTPTKNVSPAKSKKSNTTSKQQNATPAQPTSATAKPAAATATAAASQSPAPQRAPRQRGNAEGIKKMLQKDLGIKPKPKPTPAASATSQSASTTASTPASQKNTAQEKQKQSRSSASSSASTAKGQQSATTPKDQPAPTPPSQPSTSAPASHKVYLKHANPSQGMTEILIQQALAQYGEVTNVTIDPRKGTAIALFTDCDSLKKAVEAKKIPVASGNVEILEFKDRSSGGGRGGFRGSRGGGGGSGGSGGGGGGGGGRAGRGGGSKANAAAAAAATATTTTTAAAGSTAADAAVKADGGP